MGRRHGTGVETMTSRFSRASAAASLLLALVPSLAAAAPQSAAPSQSTARPEPRKRVLFLAGADDSHPPGTHEYASAAIVLADALARSDVGSQVECEVHHDGWPADDAAIASADTLVLIAAGADQRREDHPFLVGDRLAVVERAMARGCGLVVVHWGLFVPGDDPTLDPAILDASPAGRFLAWIGGFFDYERGPPPNGWKSRIVNGTHVVRAVRPDFPEPLHPVLNGFDYILLITDELYDHLSFPLAERRKELRFTPLLARRESEGPRQDVLPPDPATLGDLIAFAVERPDGGRGVGFSGGHALSNLGPDRFQPFLLNAIAWTAKLPIPPKGVKPPLNQPIRVKIVTGHDHPAHDWRGVAAAMHELLERDPRFEVTLATSIAHSQIQLRNWDDSPYLSAVVLACNHWDQPADTLGFTPTWRAELLDYLHDGGGLVLPHFAGSAFQPALPAGPASDWPAFRELLSARWWRYDAPSSGHDDFGPFRVELTAERHPITAGATAWITHDELYHSQAGTLPIAPLITAKSRQSGRYEPLAWAREVGGGRVFQSLLGHAPESYRSTGSARLFVRGVAWAAGVPLLELPGLEMDREAGAAATFATKLRGGEGRDGTALDARVGPLELAGADDFAARPGRSFTVECAARLFSTTHYNVLVTHQPHASTGHFDLDSRIGDGLFKAYLPGWEPSELPSPRAIADGAWHRVAMQFDATTPASEQTSGGGTSGVPSRDPTNGNADARPIATVVLFVDGAEVLRTTTRWRGRSDFVAGPLVVGASYEGTTPRCGSDALLDEVVVRGGLVAPTPLPQVPVRDDATLLLETFEPSAVPVSAPAPVAAADRPWTPPPASGPDAPPWEKETDADWRDDRFAAMEYGRFLASTVRMPPLTGRERVAKGLTVKLGPAGEVAWLFDTERCAFVAAWEGTLQFEPARFGLLSAPTLPIAPLLFATAAAAGEEERKAGGAREGGAAVAAPRYRGLHRSGERVVLEYELGGARLLESPTVVLPSESGLAKPLLVREIEVGPNGEAIELLLHSSPRLERRGEREWREEIRRKQGSFLHVLESIERGDWCGNELEGGEVIVAGRSVQWLGGADPAAGAAVDDASDRNAALESTLCVDQGGASVNGERLDSMVLELSPSHRPRALRLFQYRGPESDFAKLEEYAAAHSLEAEPLDLARLSAPGPARWGKPLVTRGVVAPDDAAYVVDSLEPPFENPWGALLYLSGLDFLPDGRAAVCTAHGDVWRVGGIDSSLQQVTWQRFATGLHQPLGLKVVDGRVIVVGRDGLTRLHDLNGDGEADWYEAFQRDVVETGGDHLFAMNLEQLQDGSLLFVKSGDRGTDHGGALLRASADGSTLTRFATGWRHGNGLAVSSAGEIVASDNQGNWVPATRLDVVREGGFHGYVPAWRGRVDVGTRAEKNFGASGEGSPDATPTSFDPPLCWIPHEVDNSAGAPIHCERRDFGPLSHQLLHLSFGKARLYAVLRDDHAAGVLPLPVNFLSGVMRGEFNARDGALYVAGCDGWQTAAVRDGCLQRVRYTGLPFHLPSELRVRRGWISLDFPEPLDRELATRIERYTLARWNYRWSSDYGSAKYRPSVGDGRSEVGEETLPIARVELAPDARRLFLFVDDLHPVDQLRLTFDLRAVDGAPVRGAVYPTLHALEE
ncbi:MAG: ThuA domain-containing protein [Planctomycetes bacterium]|nr:ThuA domain-containing protein [Planctomycetota bacterium]